MIAIEKLEANVTKNRRAVLLFGDGDEVCWIEFNML